MFLRKRAQEIVTLVEKTESEFSAAEETISGDVHIGGGETDAMRLIARAAHRLQSAYPHIAYHLFSGNADDVTERLEGGLWISASSSNRRICRSTTSSSCR